MPDPGNDGPRSKERLERRPVVERESIDPPPARSAATPLWLWILPLVLVVIGLTWYIFSRGEPSPPTLRPGAAEVLTPEDRSLDVQIRAPDLAPPRIEAPAQTPAAEPPATAPAETEGVPPEPSTPPPDAE